MKNIKIKIELFQKILKEKWFIGSTEPIFASCVFCKQVAKKRTHCHDCMVLSICADHEGNIGEAYGKIVNYTRNGDSIIDTIDKLPTQLLQAFITAIENEIKNLQSEAIN